jgi:23S rRNA (pseudouridine1915-N3)-methyltransferase
MKITILAISDKMPKWVDEVSQDYLKRFSHPIQCELIALAAPKRTSTLSTDKAKSLEADLLLAKIPTNAHCVLLDEKGKIHSSLGLSSQFNHWQLLGQPIVIVIGGADGFDPKLYARGNELWSLSQLTFPHPLVRVIAIEQLYRAWSITKGHPYHRQ